jgi:uncharacterized protein YeaO (DUF488 family)
LENVLQIKRVYQAASPEDGFRLLVDRLWPRGLSKAAAQIDLWLKNIAPSATLRRWFGHDPARWQTFQREYIAELEQHPADTEQIQALLKQHQRVTLLYAAKDDKHNHAVVLLAYLNEHNPT